MEKVSFLLKAVFVIITLLTIFQFYRAGKKSTTLLITISVWALLQLIIGNTDFYHYNNTTPPRFVLLVLPPLVLITILFLTRKGKIFMDHFDIGKLTLLHTVRIVVEMVLFYLFVANAIPQIMTFEGRNFDILAGVTAPIVYYFAFVKKRISSTVLIFWNVLCLGLLVNIVVIAILSVKTPFQRFAFEQPNIAVGYFPFNWLASVVVPIVMLSHLITLRQLVMKKVSG